MTCKICTVNIDLNDAPNAVSADFLIERRLGHCIKCHRTIRVNLQTDIS